jgi:hypothetical protein
VYQIELTVKHPVLVGVNNLELKLSLDFDAYNGIWGANSYMESVEGPRLTDCQELHQISQIRLDGDLNQISPKPVSDLTD